MLCFNGSAQRPGSIAIFRMSAKLCMQLGHAKHSFFLRATFGISATFDFNTFDLAENVTCGLKYLRGKACRTSFCEVHVNNRAKRSTRPCYE